MAENGFVVVRQKAALAWWAKSLNDQAAAIQGIH